ncbi:MAG TPA: hypothetical protein PLS49_06240 [Candidatus Woesebacteria bacterium]|nr:hypothetical protein [Candidatus Woesebacteria bacterium]
MQNSIQINKNTLLIVAILLVISFVSSIALAYQMGVTYGEETIVPMQITPNPVSEQQIETDSGMTIEQMPVEQGEREPIDSGIVVCTMEAKICPDGSSVGRMPPNCEFAPCPGE